MDHKNRLIDHEVEPELEPSRRSPTPPTIIITDNDGASTPFPPDVDDYSATIEDLESFPPLSRTISRNIMLTPLWSSIPIPPSETDLSDIEEEPSTEYEHIENVAVEGADVPLPPSPLEDLKGEEEEETEEDDDKDWTRLLAAQPDPLAKLSKEEVDALVERMKLREQQEEAERSIHIPGEFMESEGDDSASDASTVRLIVDKEERDEPDEEKLDEKETKEDVFDKCKVFFDKERPVCTLRDDERHSALVMELNPDDIDGVDGLCIKKPKERLQPQPQPRSDIEKIWDLEGFLISKDKEIAKLRARLAEGNAQLSINKSELKEAKNTIASQQRVIQRHVGHADLKAETARMRQQVPELNGLRRHLGFLQIENPNLRYENEYLKEKVALAEEKLAWRDGKLKGGVKAILHTITSGSADDTEVATAIGFMGSMGFNEGKMWRQPRKVYYFDELNGIFWLHYDLDKLETSTTEIHAAAIRFWGGDYNAIHDLLPVYLDDKTQIHDTVRKIIVESVATYLETCVSKSPPSDIAPLCALIGVLDLNYEIFEFKTLYYHVLEILSRKVYSENPLEAIHLLHLAAVMCWSRLNGNDPKSIHSDSEAGYEESDFGKTIRKSFGGHPPEVDEITEKIEDLLRCLGHDCEVFVSDVESSGGTYTLTMPGGGSVKVDCIMRTITMLEGEVLQEGADKDHARLRITNG